MYFMHIIHNFAEKLQRIISWWKQLSVGYYGINQFTGIFWLCDSVDVRIRIDYTCRPTTLSVWGSSLGKFLLQAFGIRTWLNSSDSRLHSMKCSLRGRKKRSLSCQWYVSHWLYHWDDRWCIVSDWMWMRLRHITFIYIFHEWEVHDTSRHRDKQLFLAIQIHKNQNNNQRILK